jgi:hypothetical protein
MMGFRVGRWCRWFGVIVLALGLLEFSHSIHEGNTIDRTVTVAGFVMAVTPCLV